MEFLIAAPFTVQILSTTHPDRCQIRSLAFDRSLHVAGLSAAEFEGLFRADRLRPDWPAIANRGPIRIHCGEDDLSTPTRSTPLDITQESCSGGKALLSSGRAGEVRLDPDVRPDDRLLPAPLNLLLAQQWARQGLFPLHAAALRWQGQGLLILGGQGAGKSSLVLAALDQGADIISDDWLLLGGHNEEARAERLREFLMFRPGPTWEAFGSTLGGRLDLRQNRDGRYLHAIAKENADFPAWTRLHRCLLLQPPGSERPALTSIASLDHSTLLARLVEAAMPILMTQRFPMERDQLFNCLRALISSLPAISAITGLDLVARPGQVLERLTEH